MSHLFLSYSRSDRELAGRVREDLSARGLDVWSDHRLGLGGSWLTEISTAIGAAQAVILLATPAPLASKWVLREVEAAQVLSKPVVPLLAGGTRFGDLPAGLAGINGVDLADGYEDSVQTIAETFERVVKPDYTIEPPPSTPPVLLLLTVDNTLGDVIVEIARPIGLVVVRRDPFAADVLKVAAHARITVIDGRLPVDWGFVAGYSAGRGCRVICVAEVSGWRAPKGATITICRTDASELEREICVAAFLPIGVLD